MTETAIPGFPPRLPAGPHLGFIEGFDDLAVPRGDTTLAAIAGALRADAVGAGMSIGRGQIDWAELEPAPGVYDRGALDAALAGAAAGGTLPFLTLSTLDSEGPTLPAHLPVDLGAPAVLEAFDALLGWMVPILAEAGVWGLSLGNEVDIPVEDGFVTTGDAVAFFTRGGATVAVLDPDLAVTVTFTADADLTNPALAGPLVAALDLVTINYYCPVAEGRPVEPARWGDPVRRWAELAEGRPVFLQELGCPAGYGGFEAEQAAFFASMAELILREDQVIGATVFQLVDWSPELAAAFSGPLREDGFGPAADDLEEALATLGFVRWDDGTVRPAWDAYLAGLADMAAVREGRAVWGGDGDDAIEAVPGLALIDAGPGSDTVRFGPDVAAAALTRTEDGFRIGGAEGLLLRGVDRFVFDDATLALDDSAEALAAARLYAAAFARDPDPAGAAFWAGVLAGAGARPVAAAFAGSAEFAARLGDAPDDGAFLGLLYDGVLGRAPDPGGEAYWTGRLAEGATRGDVLAAFADSAENRAATEERFEDGVLVLLG